MPKVKLTIVKKTTIEKVKKTGLTTDVFDMEGKKTSEFDLPEEIFSVPANDNLLAQTLRVYLANQRQGTLSTKTRGEVAGSTRKIFQQKGTGRARHGSIKAPIFVGGGITFGPKPRDFSLKIPQKMKTKALNQTLTAKLKSGEILVINNLDSLSGKTSEMMKILLNLKIETKHGKLSSSTLLVTLPRKQNLLLACRNIANLTCSACDLLNAYLISSHKKIIFTKEALNSLISTSAKSVIASEAFTLRDEVKQSQRLPRRPDIRRDSSQ